MIPCECGHQLERHMPVNLSTASAFAILVARYKGQRPRGACLYARGGLVCQCTAYRPVETRYSARGEALGDVPSLALVLLALAAAFWLLRTLTH